MSIMEKDLSKLDEFAQEYYLEKKKEIIQDMQRNEADNQARQDAANQAQSISSTSPIDQLYRHYPQEISKRETKQPSNEV
ncbi:hypothetical protein PtA15_13A294 [Puccinia triticina]|uniref:Uncharacterized protein n=1 Tax=Puccinia triticina TaxID=208348 RepID=A0ABY7D214_9BASI|nr:uncharacterized protein PtA15_13A294 [Puccinia triticina]WAQ90894.1 hypothetical protein PtA15_13A294 [Puccinia triticina]